MRLSTPARRRHKNRPHSGAAGSPIKLRLAAGLVGLAMVGSLGVGSIVSAQAEEPTAGAGVAAAADGTPAPVESSAAADAGADAGAQAAGGEEAAVPVASPAANAESAAPESAPAEEDAAPESAPAEEDAAPSATQTASNIPSGEQPPAGDGASSEASNGAAVLDLTAPRSRVLAAAAAKANPVLPNRCGLNMAVVLDLSNSLSDSDVTASKDAAKGVVNALSGTPSAVGVYTFGTFAPDGTNTPIAKTSVSTASGAASVNTKIGNINRVPSSVGGTNWDAALRGVARPGFDIVLFVTDGNPTAYGTPNTWSNSAVPTGNTDYGTQFDAIDLSSAVTAADALKTSGTFVMGLGVGSSVNTSNIQAISGKASGTDYFQLSDYTKLTEKLKEIALKNCQGTVSIVKQVADLDGTLAPASGWTFNGRTADNVSPSSAATGADGAVNFKVNDLQTGSRIVQFTEQQQAGYTLQSQNGRNATCVNNSTGANVAVSNSGSLGFTVSVNRADAISCQVINAKIPVQVKVTKTWVNAVKDDKASFKANATTVTGNEKTGTSTAPANGDVITASFAHGSMVNVEEVLAKANKGTYITTLKCTTADGATLVEGAQLKGSFTLGASNVTCAFTNTNTAATVVVEKKWIVDGTPYNNGDQPTGISAALTLTGPDTAGATAQAWDAVRTGYAAGNTVTLAEATTFEPGLTCELTKAEVTLANGTTTTAPMPYAAALAPGVNKYTVTNTVECTTVLTLLKFIDDSNGGTLVPGDFNLTATPEGGTAWDVQGANIVAATNTKAVTAGVNHALSESSNNNQLAYLQLALQRYTGSFNPDGSLADSDAWEDAAATNVSVATGHHEVYRFVNASVPTMTLPLTGGTGSIAYLLVGGGFLLLALLVTAWILARRGKANRA